MTVQPNGTDAKDIALYFIKATHDRATPSVMKRTIMQAKSLLSCDYTKEEIIKTIDYIVDVMRSEMYSLGYVSACINDVLKKIKQEEAKKTAQEERKKLEESFKSQEAVSEVKDDGESTKRNRSKLDRLGIKSMADKYEDIFKR